MYKKNIFLLLLFTCISFYFFGKLHANIPTIILDPEGDVLYSGRKLTTSLERTETYLFSQHLKSALTKNNDFHIIITRKPGEKKKLYQAASVANRIKADLFLSIAIAPQDEVKPTIALYYRSLNPLTENIPHRAAIPVLIPASLAHTSTILATKNTINRLYESLSTQNFLKLADCHKPLGLPIKQLAGLIIPGILIEIGISKYSSWQPLINPIANSLKNILISRSNSHGILQTPFGTNNFLNDTNEDSLEDSCTSENVT